MFWCRLYAFCDGGAGGGGCIISLPNKEEKEYNETPNKNNLLKTFAVYGEMEEKMHA